MMKFLGLLKSLIIYYGIPGRFSAMKKHYSQFITKGCLCFDIGSHVGNRTKVFSSLGAKVISIDPQEDCVRILRFLYGKTRNITIIQSAVGDTNEKKLFYECESSPTLSTVSKDWIEQMSQKTMFHGITWKEKYSVEQVTLDHLINEFGVPRFCKIDVEGGEPDVLKGLSTPLQAVSFEFLPTAKDRAIACIEYLSSLAEYEYNLSLVETMKYLWQDFVSEDTLKRYILDLDENGPSGDIYARKK
ncbi:MAG: FkbM family methyltransferase [Spirochaetia bacterium]